VTEAGKVVDRREMLAPPKRLSAFFQMVNRLISDDQVLASVPPESLSSSSSMLSVFSVSPIFSCCFCRSR
jgi:hypothetical protein